MWARLRHVRNRYSFSENTILLEIASKPFTVNSTFGEC
jgi:hypothetical protein